MEAHLHNSECSEGMIFDDLRGSHTGCFFLNGPPKKRLTPPPQGSRGFKGFSRGFKGSQGVSRGFKGFTRGFKGSQGVLRGFNLLPLPKRDGLEK